MFFSSVSQEGSIILKPVLPDYNCMFMCSAAGLGQCLQSASCRWPLVALTCHE